MAKARIVFTVTVEYDLVASYYPEGSTQDEMLAIDLAGAEEDPSSIMYGENAQWTTTICAVDA